MEETGPLPWLVTNIHKETSLRFIGIGRLRN